jgi:FKBP-type peptidyl-prolyl cis-trans isomerase FklB
MQKTSITAMTLLAAGMILAGNARAQGNAAQSSQKATPATAQQPAPAKPPATKESAGPKTGQSDAAEGQSVPALTTQKDKASYAIGMNIGKSLKRDSVDVDANLLLRGIEDALAGSTPLLTDEEAKAALVMLQNDVRQKQEEKLRLVGEANKKEGDAFLTANKAKEGVVTLPSGLQYKILTEGTGPKPTATDSVVCNYRGMLLDNTEFDSSYKRGQPATFPVSGIIKGWTEALQLMPVGSKWQLFIPPDLAYGPRGAGQVIGPNSTLVFEVELLSIQPKNEKENSKE